MPKISNAVLDPPPLPSFQEWQRVRANESQRAKAIGQRALDDALRDYLRTEASAR